MPVFNTEGSSNGGGFNFAAADPNNNAFTKKKGPGADEWMCHCEQINKNTENICSLCMMSKQ